MIQDFKGKKIIINSLEKLYLKIVLWNSKKWIKKQSWCEPSPMIIRHTVALFPPLHSQFTVVGLNSRKTRQIGNPVWKQVENTLSNWNCHKQGDCQLEKSFERNTYTGHASHSSPYSHTLLHSKHYLPHTLLGISLTNKALNILSQFTAPLTERRMWGKTQIASNTINIMCDPLAL